MATLLLAVHRHFVGLDSKATFEHAVLLEGVTGQVVKLRLEGGGVGRAAQDRWQVDHLRV